MSIADQITKEIEVVKGERSKIKVYNSARAFPDIETAKLEFAKAKKKLFDVNAWSSIPGIGNANFTLHTPAGVRIGTGTATNGDFIKIDLPGPVPYYWVEVLNIKEEEDLAEFTVKPSHDPSQSEKREVTDHFFHEEARSTFRVQRRDNEIVAAEIGTGEEVNNEGREAGKRAVVNTVVAESGWAFFQKNQWKNLTDYLVGIS